MILISAKQKQGFWRCGVFHSSEQAEYADDAFTPEQIEILKAEPMLSVFITENAPVAGGENEPAGDDKKPKAKSE